MGRKSTLRRLPPEIRAEINRILSEGRLTLDELLEHLRSIGVEGVSRSALGRQKQKIDKIAAKLRQSREMTEALVREIGPAVEEGQQGRLLVEVLRRLVFDHLEKRLTSEDEESQDIDNQGFFFFAKAIKEMSQANRPRCASGSKRKPSRPWKLPRAKPGFRPRLWKPSRAVSLG